MMRSRYTGAYLFAAVAAAALGVAATAATAPAAEALPEDTERPVPRLDRFSRSQLDALKNEARRAARAQQKSLQTCLNAIAVREGYATWALLVRRHHGN